jgi:hypothetical protein
MVHYRPRVSRETRLLVVTSLLAVLALWMLARMRFPSPPAQPQAISSLLSSLAAGADFDGLANQIARTRAVVGNSLLTVDFEPSSGGAMIESRTALRLGGDVAVVEVPEGARLRDSGDIRLIGHDIASGLAVLRVTVNSSTSVSMPRVARRLQVPQYVSASAVYPDGVALRPVFVAAVAVVDAPLWSAQVWAVPRETGFTPGSFLFTRDGEFAGMAVRHRDGLAVVPSEIVLDEANRLIARQTSTPADLGIQVDELSSALQHALGVTTGVVVTWVNPNGPSQSALAMGDVIESVDGQPTLTIEHWRRSTASARIGVPLLLGVRRAGAGRSISIEAPATSDQDPVAPPVGGALGASTRTIRGSGTEVTAVSPDTRAARAGLQSGDLITFIGATSMPTAAQINDVMSSLKGGQSVLLGVRRGSEHRLLVLER